MKWIQINSGGEELSIEYYLVNGIVFIDSIQNNGIDITDNLTNEVYSELETKIQDIEYGLK